MFGLAQVLGNSVLLRLRHVVKSEPATLVCAIMSVGDAML